MTLNELTCERAIGAIWFAGWATLAAAMLYLYPAIESGGSEVLLFVLLPGMAALPVGAWIAPRLLDRRIARPWKSLALGIVAAVLTHVVFVPLFSFGWWVSAPESTNMPGLAWTTATVGLVMVGVVTVPIGGLAGWLLYWIARAWREKHR